MEEIAKCDLGFVVGDLGNWESMLRHWTGRFQPSEDDLGKWHGLLDNVLGSKNCALMLLENNFWLLLENLIPWKNILVPQTDILRAPCRYPVSLCGCLESSSFATKSISQAENDFLEAQLHPVKEQTYAGPGHNGSLDKMTWKPWTIVWMLMT